MLNKKFICASEERADFAHSVPAPLFRRSFNLNFTPDCAELSICGLGFYLLTVNGKDITKGYLAPYISNPDHILYYDTYDVRPYLQHGENVIGIVLGNGFMNPFAGAVWDFDKVSWIGAPRLAMSFTASKGAISYSFEADEKFLTHPSPWEFNEYRMGEIYHAEQETDWALPGADVSDWTPAVPATAPKGRLKKCDADPILPRKELKPVEIIKTPDGYIYDFGENCAGICRLCLPHPKKGQEITIRFCEHLLNGAFSQTYMTAGWERNYPFYATHFQTLRYTAAGRDEEIWEPKFSYHGYRYALVQGITDEQAKKSLLTYIVLNSALREIGSFHCSDADANHIFEMVRNSDLSNFYYFPTDCPHREKNGWTGDASLSAPQMTLLFDTEASYREWLENIILAQREDGALPGIIPTGGWGFAWGNGPTWDSVLFNLPYVLYKLRGVTDCIELTADAMIRYLRYISGRRNPDGTVSIGLGDWVPVAKQSNEYATPLAVTDSIMVMDVARKADEMLTAVGRTQEASYAKEVYTQMRTAIRKNLFDAESCIISGKTQTGQAMAIYYGVLEENEILPAFRVMLDLIKNNNDSFDCGFIGMHAMFKVLSDFGESELAYRMLMKPEFPSYRNLIAIGETSIPESFQPVGGRDPGSHNHHFLGDIARWYMYDLAGLQVMDHKTVRIRPSFIKELNNAEASYQLPGGTVSVRWVRGNGVIYLSVSYPKDVKCDISLPDTAEPVIQNIQAK